MWVHVLFCLLVVNIGDKTSDVVEIRTYLYTYNVLIVPILGLNTSLEMCNHQNSKLVVMSAATLDYSSSRPHIVTAAARLLIQLIVATLANGQIHSYAFVYEVVSGQPCTDDSMHLQRTSGAARRVSAVCAELN